jgi:hypothetical protein
VPAGDKKYNISSKVVEKAFGTAMAGLCFIDYVFPEIEMEVRDAWATLLSRRYGLSRAERQQQANTRPCTASGGVSGDAADGQTLSDWQAD